MHRCVFIPHVTLLGGYSADHPVIRAFWRVVEGFTDEEKRKLLKFVTSCSRPPLLGFKVLLCAFALKPLVTEEGSGIPCGALVAGRALGVRGSGIDVQ